MDIPEDMDMDYVNDMGGNGMDIMDIMRQTRQQMNNPIDEEEEEPANGIVPDFRLQQTTKLHHQELENTFTGKPLIPYTESPEITSPDNNVTINLTPAIETYADVTINLGAAARDQSIEPYMDDDFDDFDAKDDLTKDQQKQDGNVKLARHIDKELNRVADDVMNVDELEQQYRMTKDPENPNNIFVLKFGANEEQHWRLPWNGTTNLLCHMEPNKLLIEQSKYNAMYIKHSVTPREFKEMLVTAKKKQILKVKEKNKKYIMNVNSDKADKVKAAKKKPQTAKFGDDFTSNSNLNVTNLAAPTANNDVQNLLAPKMGNKPRGTFLVNNSMLVHSAETVAAASPTEQQKTLQETKQLLLNPVDSAIAQIAPELMQAAGTKKSKYQRRVSLEFAGDEHDWNDNAEQEYSESDIDSEEDVGDAEDQKRASKLDSIQLSVSVSHSSMDPEVQRIDEAENDFGRSAYEQKLTVDEAQPSRGKIGLQTHIGRAETADMSTWSPPRISLSTWNAVDVWQGILYLGDEWDALNYLEIMDNSIEYFINCAAGYCAFEYEHKLKHFWLEHWRRQRTEEREKQKSKNTDQREKRRKIRLKKFQRAHPEWKPKNRTLLQSHSTIKTIPDESDPMYQFALKVGSNGSEAPVMQENVKKIKYKVPKHVSEDVRQSFEYFASERAEYSIISSLHNEILSLEVDDSDHSSMYDSCISSDEYQYDSDEYDEYLTMSDEEIINKLCPFKFLNIYAHNWEGYRLLDLHMNDVWNFIEECRMKNISIKKQWNQNYNTNASDKEEISCLIFCTKNNISVERLNREMMDEKDGNGQEYVSVGNSICVLTESNARQQINIENEIWNQQIAVYSEYIDKCAEAENENEHKLNVSKKKIKTEITNKRKYDRTLTKQRYEYKYWHLSDSVFWTDFEVLNTRNEALNRIFASSFDRSGTLVLAFMIHSGIRLKQAFKALLGNKPNTLRNQSFLRQLIQLDWMKHCFAKPGMKQQVPFRDEYDCYELDSYLSKKMHYNL